MSDPVFFGWIDENIETLLARPELARMKLSYVMLTMVDSIVDLPSTRLGESLLASEPKCRSLGRSVIVPRDTFSSSHFVRLRGFDEIWLFDQEPSREPDFDYSIASPKRLDLNEPSQELASWMHSADCRLGLGGGEGTNFITTDADIQVALVDLSQ